jgi:NagD protein
MYFIDVQGTLIDDKNRLPIKGATDFIDKLNQKRIPYIIVTNNTKQESLDFIEYINSIGFNITKDNYLDPLQTIKDIPTKELIAFGTNEFLSILKNRGFNIDSKKPEVALLGIKKNYNSEEFATIIDAILTFKTKLIGMHGTTIYAKDGRRYPAVGSYLKMLEFATGVTSSVIGKPSEIFYNKALSLIQTTYNNNSISFKDIVMISDDLKGDLVGAKNLGMQTVFVLSGKYKNASEIIPSISKYEQPNRVENSIQDLLKEL